MRKLVLSLISIIFPFFLFSQELNVIPKINQAELKEGVFTLDSTTQLVLSHNSMSYLGDFLNDFLIDNYQINLNKKSPDDLRNNSVNFILDTSFEEESYGLSINSESIVIKGDTAGLFNGLQTLMQLMPIEKTSSIILAQVEVKDQPRFKHRGAMLDVGRYFFTTEEIKRFLDLMAYYKLNVFHWHLTEDAGWRIEIKKHPLLTQIGAWRRGTQISHPHESFDKLPHGGFYTQEQIKDIVEYAQKRNITVIPEINMPGHTLAALAAYPELSCTKDSFKVLEHWAIQKDVMCAGSEYTYQFVEDVLDEVIELFPSKIIHIGGDEVPKDRWKECPNCQEKMRKERLGNEKELQSYFVKRVGDYLHSKGKRILGWDEIMEGGLLPNAMVMSWRGEEGGINASNMHHEVIMSPNNYMYLDYFQANPEIEPVNIHGYLPLDVVYSYEPISQKIKEENQKYIIGIQGNLWMEYIHSQEKLDYMAYPRLAAVSEIAWSIDNRKDFEEFQSRLSHNLNWLDKKRVNFRIPDPIGLTNVKTDEDEIFIKLEPPLKGSKIYYTIDGSDPMKSGLLYIDPVKIDLTDTDLIELNCIVRTLSGSVSGTRKAVYTREKD